MSSKRRYSFAAENEKAKKRKEMKRMGAGRKPGLAGAGAGGMRRESRGIDQKEEGWVGL